MPTWNGFLVTVLEVLKSGETLRAREVQDRVADHVGLTVEQCAEVLDSGQPRFRNRVVGQSHL
ncbi:winged helix-turn-helix domain-containing protein [Actinomycetospora sp.]|uniref:winged helix-turn-helix domain-containing protein n=1 Tax=Actinomycetospora sp. TaxID=1872135 RepID=UPI002F3F9D2C